jgi:predicted CoA-binding protein
LRSGGKNSLEGKSERRVRKTSPKNEFGKRVRKASLGEESEVGETESEQREILSKCRSIAVLGIKANPASDAFRVPKYMQDHGYRVIPVNPKVESVLGERAFARLVDIDEPVDLVNIFRAVEHLPTHAEEILAMSPRPTAVWMQLGIHHGPTAAKLRAAGITVVQDRCIMVEHRQWQADAGDGQAA